MDHHHHRFAGSLRSGVDIASKPIGRHSRVRKGIGATNRREIAPAPHNFLQRKFNSIDLKSRMEAYQNRVMEDARALRTAKNARRPPQNSEYMLGGIPEKKLGRGFLPEPPSVEEKEAAMNVLLRRLKEQVNHRGQTLYRGKNEVVFQNHTEDEQQEFAHLDWSGDKDHILKAKDRKYMRTDDFLVADLPYNCSAISENDRYSNTRKSMAS